MAIVISDGLVSAKGKIGGSVYFSNGIRKQVRAYQAHTSNPTVPQLSQRSFFQDAKNAWNALSFDMVLQWGRWASQYNWKKGAYQYFIHCYMKGIGPVPVDYTHLVVKRQITVSEMLALSVAPIDFVPAPGLGKYNRPRIVSVFCDNFQYSGDPSFTFCFGSPDAPFFDPDILAGRLEYLGLNFLMGGWGVPGLFENKPLSLYCLSPFFDLGSSTDLFIEIEYSILDYYKA